VLGDWGARLLLVGGVISIFATLSGDMLGAPRVLFASARDNNLPRFLATVHPKYKTPYVSVIFFAAVVCALALSATFKPLAVLASGSILVIYLGVSLAVLRLRHRDGEPDADQFKLPFGPAVPALSCVVVVWLLWQLTAGEAAGLAALIGASVLVYGIRTVGMRIPGGTES
jgi:APA family basic amino acid/polyamine antiporter